MFEIGFGESGAVRIAGRFDAAQADQAEAFLDAVQETTVLDFSALEYVSSAGLGVLLGVQKRLMGSGHGLEFVNVNRHIHDVFRYSGFDRIFKITPAGE